MNWVIYTQIIYLHIHYAFKIVLNTVLCGPAASYVRDEICDTLNIIDTNILVFVIPLS